MPEQRNGFLDKLLLEAQLWAVTFALLPLALLGLILERRRTN